MTTSDVRCREGVQSHHLLDSRRHPGRGAGVSGANEKELIILEHGTQVGEKTESKAGVIPGDWVPAMLTVWAGTEFFTSTYHPGQSQAFWK